MNKILNKRDGLERFIKEQIIGPGVNGYRYVDLENTELLEKKLTDEKPLDYHNEILDIAPAAVYSTGILFPEDNSGTMQEGVMLDNNENSEQAEDLTEVGSQNNSSEDTDVDSGIDLNQMHPKTMGLTCCLKEDCLKDEALEFVIRTRYYKKIKQDKEGNFNNRYGLLLEADLESTRVFLVQHKLTNTFNLRTIGVNSFLTISRINSTEITVVKTRIRSIQKEIAENLYDKTAPVCSLKQLTKSKIYLSSLKSFIYYEIKNHQVDDGIKRQLYNISQEIEVAENITDHLRDLLDVISNGYGLWQSEDVERVVKLKSINFPKPAKKRILSHKRHNHQELIEVYDGNGVKIKDELSHIFKFNLNEHGDDFASLSVNLMFSRDVRKDDDRIFLKIQLINTSTPFTKQPDDSRYYSTFNELVNQKSFFGVTISIDNVNLVPYSDFQYKKEGNYYNEDTTTRFIYDEFKDYGIGHGCSVKWDSSKHLVETEYVPTCDTPDIDPTPRNKNAPPYLDTETGEYKDPLFLASNRAQEFKTLSIFSNESDESILKLLMDFVDSYGKWISIKRSDNKFNSDNRELCQQELDKCEEDYLRMRNNIASLLAGKQNAPNIKAFRLMNAVMFMQLWHANRVKNHQLPDLTSQMDFTGFNYDFYRDNASEFLLPDKPVAAWRAFQLAFILLNLDGIFFSEEDPKWEKRNNWVDLVWFPTGGGKTEAYLGLIALTIINRRQINGEFGGGTAAIMRYTLRLLTMQQFQRATLLIMALELVRRWSLDKYDLGREPITIGLWVGKNSIPNSNADLVYEYEHKLNLNKENRIPFAKCPWCNSAIKGETKQDADATTDVFNKNRVHLKCVNTKCPFSFGIGRVSKKGKDQGPIPVCLSDEIIYQHPPSLLFGTVDKFAQLAHKVGSDNTVDSRRLFGRGDWEKGKPKKGYIPPDLIIQDELHLLLGPLGSAVALFESAINQLCTRPDGTRPKVISSTATTRNTHLQIAALFDREVNLFPKPGVECDDSFFAYYKRKYSDAEKGGAEYLSKRKYIGVLPTGRTQIWMQMRLAAIISTHRAIYELQQLAISSPLDFDKYAEFDKVIDYYHTTISYFNSLKEVGKTQSQIQAYMLKELRRVFTRSLRPQKLMHSIYTYGPIEESELTGRLSGEEVKNELKKVESKWSAKNRFAHSSDEHQLLKGVIPPEFVVATNMISVGIDVSRFNIIIMNSMPRNIAEYIQASSRVARESYGLVVTVHHPFRARDVSHYEKFIEFHEKMYSYVEPISITPFTEKSIQRYLGLYVATMIRHFDDRFTDRTSADGILLLSDSELDICIGRVSEYFTQRQLRLSVSEVEIQNLLKPENLVQIKKWIRDAISEWKSLKAGLDANTDLVFTNKKNGSNQKRKQEQLYVNIEEYEKNIHSKKWQVPMSLRVIEPEAAIKIYPY
jgi:hypothetical protein